MAVRLRVLSNGFLIAPKRGAPPAIPEGYERSRGDPYILIPTLPVCIHREIREPPRRCCGYANFFYCLYYNERVIRSKCADCGGKP